MHYYYYCYYCCDYYYSYYYSYYYYYYYSYSSYCLKNQSLVKPMDLKVCVVDAPLSVGRPSVAHTMGGPVKTTEHRCPPKSSIPRSTS